MAQPLAPVRSSLCSCCHRRGARYMIRLDLHGQDVTAVCPACDTQGTGVPGWTDPDEDGPRA